MRDLTDAEEAAYEQGRHECRRQFIEGLRAGDLDHLVPCPYYGVDPVACHWWSVGFVHRRVMRFNGTPEPLKSELLSPLQCPCCGTAQEST